jgi:hypothetical protein
MMIWAIDREQRGPQLAQAAEDEAKEPIAR